MINKNYTIKTVETLFVESIDVVCDGCGITIAHYNEDGDVCKPHINDYFYVVTGHFDWGNDSCESIKKRCFCPKCIDKVYEEYKALCLNRDDTRYIEINHRCTSFEWREEEL